MEQSKFHTIDEVAARWRVTGQTVRDLIEKGALNAFKVGYRWRIGEKALLEYESRRLNNG